MADAQICRSLYHSAAGEITRFAGSVGSGCLVWMSKPNGDEGERHVVPVRVFKRHPCRLNPRASAQALASLFCTCIFSLFFFLSPPSGGVIGSWVVTS